MLAQQWHLGTTVSGHYDLNVRQVWAPSAGGPAYTGAGIRVAVLDDGYDYNHPDFDRYNRNIDWDFLQGDADPFGVADDAHGTAVAGLIGAAADGRGAVGVAFGVEMTGYRLGGDSMVTSEAAAIKRAATTGKADVINLSWGIEADLRVAWGHNLPASGFAAIDAAIATAVNQGRGGLGTSIIKAAGNEREINFDSNADNWGQDTRQVIVGAVDKNGWVSDYSTTGSTLLVSAFGTPEQVVTTDRVGRAGYSLDSFADDFNGTSAATPMVAGVVALMYDANAGLGWRDVQSILAASARHVGSAVGGTKGGDELFGWKWNKATTWNGGGMHFSNDYGYGLVDARGAVRLAETWLLTADATRSSNQKTASVDVLNTTTTTIPDGSSAGKSFSGDIGAGFLVERATVKMTLDVDYTEDLKVMLVSSKGTVSTLISNVAALDDDQNVLGFTGAWTFETQAFRGERAAGTWSVKVVDAQTGDAIKVSDIDINLFGADTKDDRYILTNDYSRWAGRAGHATVLSDGNGGNDVVNASAVSTDSIIRLRDTTSSRIDGVTLTIKSNIEDAIGGDGADRLEGNSADNWLWGMRRDDNLSGREGADELYGGDGSDRLTGGAGADWLVGGAGNDVFDFNFRSESAAAGGVDEIAGQGSRRAFDGAGAGAGDRIDLSGIDGRDATAGHQDLVFATGGSAQGTFRVIELANGASRVDGYTNATSGADFSIVILDGAVLASQYTAADFIL